MARFSVPAQPSRSVLHVDRLLGVDMTNDPGNVAKEQSPCGDNMIRDVPGKVRKCMGYQRIATLSGAVHGCHFFKDEALVLLQVHLLQRQHHQDPARQAAHQAGGQGPFPF